MFDICVLAEYKVKITTKWQYDEVVDYYCDIGAITETRKETTRKQKTMKGGELSEFISDLLKERDWFEIQHKKDNELIIDMYNVYNTFDEMIKIIRWEVKV